jgi:DNA topoisomerase-1
VPERKKQPVTKSGAPLAKNPKKPARTATTTARKPRTPALTDGGAPRAGRHDLVIVESPAKAKTINKYLGSTFKVLASYGHVRDLPKRRKKGETVAGIDIQGGWVPTYVVTEREEGKPGRRTAKDILAELKREANKSNRIFLATDPDREGEAIAWHIEDALGLDPDRTFRVAFNEITRTAVQNALAHPGKIDMDRVHAQEARRILDRVVGYPLSNLLSKKVARRSSAGRVQSVALRLVVDREREIEAFKSEEYWKLTAVLASSGFAGAARPFEIVESKKTMGQDSNPDEAGPDRNPDPQPTTDSKLEVPPGAFAAELAEWNGQKVKDKDGKYVFPANRETATGLATILNTASYRITSVEQKDRSEKAPPPFITSTLQQQANLRLRFTASRTMQIAQRLYEGVDLGGEGSVALITYMRTDSTRVSNEALQAVRGYIGISYGQPYLPEKPNVFASGKSAQEAHEAIRPTDVANTPERVAHLGLHGEPLRLYTLIFNRFVASQMTAAVFAITNVDILARNASDGSANPSPALALGAGQGTFKAQGKILKFDGFRRVLAPHSKDDDATLPVLSQGQALDRIGGRASQHYTQPPPRYNEASLVKALEKEGIGRPSTYASIISKITSEDRGYVEVKDRRFYATTIGKVVTDLLNEHFPKVMDLKFTSHFEEELDDIETRKMEYHDVLNEFWGPFSEALRTAEEKMPTKRGAETGEMCPVCGRPLVANYSKKTGREFIGCSGFRDPETPCKYIKPREGEEARPEPEMTDIPCPTCAKPMRKLVGKAGPFLGCSGYPECKTTMNFDESGKPVLASRTTEHLCEKCGKQMVIRAGRRGPFLACTGYPKCKNAKDVDANGNPVQPIDTGIKCEKCGSPMIVRKGRIGTFLGCSAYPKCRSTKPVPEEMKEKLKELMPAAPKKAVPAVEVTETCPDCGGPMKLRPGRRGYFLGCAKYPKCKGTREAPPEVLEQAAAAAT